MAVPFIIAICLCGVFCLTPIAMYLVWLTTIKQRRCPTVLSAGVDLALLSAALSGFILFGGAIILAGLQSNARLLFRGNWEQIRSSWGQENSTWLLIGSCYLIVVIVSLILIAWRRRRTVTIYECDLTTADILISNSLAKLGLQPQRLGHVWKTDQDILSVDPMEEMEVTTIRFLHPDRRLYEEFVRELRFHASAFVHKQEANTRWLVFVLSCCFTVIVASLLLVFYFFYLSR